jgi:hypothetical protein
LWNAILAALLGGVVEDIDQKAQRDLPDLREWVNRLLDLTINMLESVPYSEDDNFGFMALCFASKQVDHMRSILALNESRDVWLIARSMLEGRNQLLWAARDPDVHAQRWRAFALVHDWREMRTKIEAGETVDPTLQHEIEEGLLQYGDQFLTQPARNARSRGTAMPPNPYYDNWTGRTVRQIFEDVGGGILYQQLYKSFSNWHHWSPGGLGTAISRDGQHVSFLISSPAETATALAAGFQCLLETAEITDRHLRLGLELVIAQIRDGYIAWGQAQSNTENTSND